ncbi:SusC/RagA family TonB-linked outer membrane protein [Litoribacter ruber]|uniref:SusC/RagA family TonB-linked outer membrane protein n=1 Tax=Litoribacter ruber TaxID=702568 RepID=UPI001BDB6B3C|nr:SusC/RagA family TonB-linked outer membrane protein [Litoribacter ruber]MBT0812988.1 SusC/RagA family TonB-linked outer membrane protein [Litoribacter ruber]
MKKTLLIWLAYLICGSAIGQEAGSETFTLRGTVMLKVDNTGLPGATVMSDDRKNGTVTDENGNFSLLLSGGLHNLSISFLGYVTQEIEIRMPANASLEVYLEEASADLETVEVVSTGYQELPKERLTGSFVQVDKELVNRRVSPNILERLEDVTPGLVFNRDAGSAGDPLSIRGRSSLFANTMPLIVIDNFPYDGPIENINPNDVESITVLRDAAAASIWGAQAGNGVIVITTKKGGFNTPTKISLNSNATVSEFPDLFYRPLMSSGEVIGVESMLFQRGVFNNAENNVNRPALSPVVEALIRQRDGISSPGETNTLLGQLATHDVRSDLERYYYRRPVHLQQSLQVSGGSTNHSYNISLGYDRSNQEVIGNRDNRMTFSARNNWRFLNNRLNVDLMVFHTGSSSNLSTELPFEGAYAGYAYDRLADAEGRGLPLIRDHRQGYIDGLAGQGLMDWRFVPLAEIGIYENRTAVNDNRANLALNYNILPGLTGEVLYQYWSNNTDRSHHRPLESYFVRNMINRFTQTGTDGSLSRAIPEGGMLDISESSSISHSLRAQLKGNTVFNEKHELNYLAGYEVKDLNLSGNGMRYYGYDSRIGVSSPVDFVNRFRMYYNPVMQQNIPNNVSHIGRTDRFLSYYTNLGYMYDHRLMLSASARMDASNLFGVETNQRRVPLWSVGGGWIVSNEKFYGLESLPYLKFRYTYGYNGNIDRTLSAYTTARYFAAGTNNLLAGIPLPYAQIVNPPNPELRWERIKISNFGIDFESKNGILEGHLELYKKEGLDLIGDTPFPPSSGVLNFRGNYADTRTYGFDLALNTVNLRGKVNWTTNLIASHVNEKVTSYGTEVNLQNYLRYGTSLGQAVPMEGRPLFGVYSYPWAGLDPDTGDPMGYVNGEASSDYALIFASANRDNINFHGSGRPTYFGSVRNNFSYGRLTLSMNISYRLGYFYKRESISYGPLFSGMRGHGDFSKRWQAPGDEAFTNIPSMPLTAIGNRDTFYQLSSVLVERGDHVRLQDINVSYTFPNVNFKRHSISRLEIYSYINNLGVLWKASDDPLDPDFRTMRPLTSVSLGLRADF